MRITELYSGVPKERHQEIVISGDRLFFDNEEYVIEVEGELKLVRSQKGLEQRLAQVETKLGIKQTVS